MSVGRRAAPGEESSARVVAALPSILAEIVAQRRRRYGVSAEKPEVFPFNESFSPFSKEKAKAFIEGRRDRPSDVGVRARGRRVIAEVKLGSPRLGSLVGRVDPERQAAIYAENGATALSVVVEPDFFFGSWELLRRAKEASGLPTVAKDFVVSVKQLDEAVAAGADVILLIAALYSAEELRSWAAAARERGLVPLVETHEAEEVARLGQGEGEGRGESGGAGRAAEWELVGINNRDLRTFAVEIERSIALRPSLPAGAFAVAESGIASAADAERLVTAGFDALLIGESLLLADDPAAKLRELVGA